jgi:integrase/recombinase XerD
VALLAQHLHAEDPRHEIPAIRVFTGDPYRRAVPYIFTRRQISTLVGAAFKLKATYSLRPFTFGTLFALLAVTGLRISEALALRFEDVTSDGLRIRNTKFYKSRLVPLHPSVLAGLGRYLRLRRQLPGDHVFAANRGEPLTYGCVKIVFAKLLTACGIDRYAGSPRPRLHCLRHSFAVRVLEQCPSGREQITRHQLALTTYLGHASLESTFWYHEATPHLLRGIAHASEAYARGHTS